MHSTIYKTLSQYVHQTTQFVDSLIISAFLEYNQIQFEHNQLLTDYKIPSNAESEPRAAVQTLLNAIKNNTDSFSIEDLIELFEFVVSPSDKVVNGAVYTPLFIRSLIIQHLLTQTNAPLSECTIYDPATGCGAFLLTFAKEIKTLTGRTYQIIFQEQLFGADIADYSLQRARLLLTLQAVMDGEDVNFNFNLITANSLHFNPVDTFQANGIVNGFDLVTGNPPYVSSRNMDEQTLALALNWSVSQTGHPDLYIPFFQIGIEALSPQGLLGYITVNTFIKSINGRALRTYFDREQIDLKIINFGGEQIFKDRNTYTCICIISRNNSGISYYRTESTGLTNLENLPFRRINYADLNHFDGWNLVNSDQLAQFITQVEQTGSPFKELYETKNGIATLMNDVYKFKPEAEDEHFYYLRDGDELRPIEIGICRSIVNANKLKNTEDINRLTEKIIFPYRLLENQIVIIPENEMITDFPNALNYLNTKRVDLATRDKGQRTYEVWYAYGRRQSMDLNAYKLFFPHICDKPSFVICDDLELLFYNGIAVVSNDLEELQVLKRILESEIFYQYIKNTTKDYSSGYISMSRNYLKNFGIPTLSDQQKRELLEAQNVNALLAELYQIDPELIPT